MDLDRIVKLLMQVWQKEVSSAQAVARLRHLPFEDLGFAKIDHHRALRRGFPEVILGEGKEPKEIAAIVGVLRRRKAKVLVTRLSAEKMALVKKLTSGL